MEEIDKWISWWSIISFSSDFLIITISIIIGFVVFKLENKKKKKALKSLSSKVLFLTILTGSISLLSLFSASRLNYWKNEKDSIEQNIRDSLALNDRYPIKDFSFYVRFEIKYPKEKSPLRYLGYDYSDNSTINKISAEENAKKFYKENFSRQHFMIGLKSKTGKADEPYDVFLNTRHIDMTYHYLFAEENSDKTQDGFIIIYFRSTDFDARLHNFPLEVIEHNSKITSLLDLRDKDIFLYMNRPPTNYNLEIDKLILKNGTLSIFELTDFHQAKENKAYLKPSNIRFLLP